LLLLLGLPDAGTISIGGLSLAEVDPDAWRRDVAFLPQRPYLPPRSSLRQAIQWAAPGADESRMLRSIERVGLLRSLGRTEQPLDLAVDSLSTGQRQRLALARLLCRDAKLFLLDEPDANLDREGVSLVAEVVQELSQRASVVFAAHTHELLESATQRVLLDRGTVLRSALPPGTEAAYGQP
jgi:ABC-type transport system involved in cytochrome bd biosynthesis fused ATPase/permease subunit